MKCDGCENDATVHNLVIVNGKPNEQHLCEPCAAKKGLGDPIVPVAQLLLLGIKNMSSPLGLSAVLGADPADDLPAVTCESCGLTLAHFRHGGLLGCPGCYDAFAAQLGPLLDRAHDGATHHTGKIPGRVLRGGPSGAGGTGAGGTGVVIRMGIELADFERREHALRKQLDAAVAAEQFERAACLRDELQKLVNLVTGTGAGSTDPHADPTPPPPPTGATEREAT